MMDTPRTLVVGLDAACWPYLTPLLEEGRLPHLKSLMDTGISGELRSTIPAYTPTAWASIVTGKNPGKHGIYDFMWRKPDSYEFLPANATIRLGTPFWKYLNEEGVRVGLVNIPFTHPPDPLDGFVVTGFGTPPSVKDITYPPEVIDWIRAEYGDYEPWLRTEMEEDKSLASRMKSDAANQANQVKIASQLAHLHQVDVLVINLMLPDHANHWLHEMSQVEEALVISDAHLGELAESFEADHVMVLSDHGSRRIKGDFLLHLWLEDRGYLKRKLRSRAEREEKINWLLMRKNRRRGKTGMGEAVSRNVQRRLLNSLPGAWLEKWLAAQHEWMPFAREIVLFDEAVDYLSTMLFSSFRWAGILYLNQAGREPAGSLSSEEACALKKKLKEELLQITDPETGERLISDVKEGEALFEGGAAKYAPDLVLLHYDSPWNVVIGSRHTYTARDIQHRYFARNRWIAGVHAVDGIYLFSGPSFQQGRGMPGHIMDVPATLLQLYGIAIPDDYDGKVMEGVFTPAFTRANPLTRQAGDPEEMNAAYMAYSSAESEELAERLRLLGYLD